MVNFKLRDYQVEDLCSMIEAARRVVGRADGAGAERALSIVPTGGGKTLLMLAFARWLRRKWGWRTLITVPFRKLIYQTAATITERMPDLTYGLIGDGHFSLDGDVVIAVQASLTGEKLQQIPKREFQLIVCDEAHHAAAESYARVLDYFNEAKLILGMTATFIRGDDVSIASDQYFPNVIVWRTVGQLTRAGYLVKAFGYYKYTGISLEDVKIRKGKFVEDQLSHAVNTPERNDMAVDAWFEFMEGYSTAVYCVDIRHAQAMAERFRARGVPAEAVWGTMPKAAYDRVMEDYRAGKILVLPNAKLLTEGWDAPLTSGILLAKPITKTAANVLVPQMFGRALRPDPETGKTHAVIVEMRDLPKQKRGEDENLSISGLAAFVKTDEANLTCGRIPLHEQASRSRALSGWNERRRLLERLSSAEEMEKDFKVIERLALVSAYAWVPLGSTLYMPLSSEDFIEIVEENPFSYEVRTCLGGELKSEGIARFRDVAIEIADQWVTAHISDKRLILNHAGWRKNQPSEGQIHYAQSLTQLPYDWLKQLTCGQVSDLIKSALALQIQPQLNFQDLQTLDHEVTAPATAQAPGDYIPHAWQIQNLAH